MLYLYGTDIDFIAFTLTGEGWERFYSMIWWMHGVSLLASIWALRAALWRHGISSPGANGSSLTCDETSPLRSPNR